MASSGRSGPGRYSDRVLLRKSSPAGLQQRLNIRKKNQPQDGGGYHFNTPGSMNPRKCGS